LLWQERKRMRAEELGSMPKETAKRQCLLRLANALKRCKK